MPDKKALPALPEGPTARPIGRSVDFDEVISQIKREVLIEISSFSQSGARQRSYVDRQIRWNSGTAAADFDNLPDDEFKRLFNQTMREARLRGLVSQERGFGEANLAQSLLAVLLFPASRRRLANILRQTALEGLDLVEQANTLMAKAKTNIVNMIGDELY